MIFRKLSLSILLSLCVFLSVGFAKDKITEIKVNVFPKTAKIRPSGTAIIYIEFFGIKKKGLFGNLLGTATKKKIKGTE